MVVKVLLNQSSPSDDAIFQTRNASGHFYGVGDAQGLLLGEVAIEGAVVVTNLLAGFGTDDESDLLNTATVNLLDGVVEDGLVGDRD